MEIFVGVVVLIVGAFVLQGLRQVPADPPHVGAVTVFGERTGAVKREGWRFFPLYPWWYGVVLVNVTKVNQDLPPQLVRTPDFAELEIPVSLTWTPDRDDIIQYLNSGGENGVKTILQDIVRERLREWAIAVDEGPLTWEAALKAQDEATAILVEEIVGLPKPTTDTEIEQRRDLTSNIRRGNGVQHIPQLGIVLNRLNVGEIKPKGKLAEAMELQVKEAREREAEVLELQHVAARINDLRAFGFTNEQALEIIQTERDKVKKNISEVKWNVSPETRAMIEKVSPELLEKLISGWKGGKP